VSHAGVFLSVGAGVLLLSGLRASRQVVIPLWADHLGLDPTQASLIYGISGAIDMLVFYPAGKLMDRKGRQWVAVPSTLIPSRWPGPRSEPGSVCWSNAQYPGA